MSKGKVDSNLNHDSIVRVATKIYRSDATINILAGEYFERENDINSAKAYYARAAKSKDTRIKKIALQKLNSLAK